MATKKYKHLLFLILLFVVSTAAYIWFAYSPYYNQFVTWSQSNVVIYYIVLVTVKAVGIVWPPLPGAVLTVGAIWIIGWIPAYISDWLGSMIGSVFAYYIAYKWGYPIMEKILDQKTIDKIKEVKVRKGRELEAVFLFRLFGGTLVEIVVYAAGVLKIPFRYFILGSMISHAVTGIPTYYLAGQISGSNHVILNSLLLFIAVLLFIFFRKRYFEKHSVSNL